MNEETPDLIETKKGHKFKYIGSFIYYECINCSAKAEKQFVALMGGKLPIRLVLMDKENYDMSCNDIKMRDMLK